MIDQDFLKWLTVKIEVILWFCIHVVNRREHNREAADSNSKSIESKHKCYHMWVTNSINSKDARNGGNLISICKSKYNTLYRNIENKSVKINSIFHKRWKTTLPANRIMLTCTLQTTHQQFKDSGLTTSIGTIMNLKPFFITYSTEKEIAFCLCKLCLNVRLLLEPLISKAKADGDVVYGDVVSTTNFSWYHVLLKKRLTPIKVGNVWVKNVQSAKT